jgi:predicted membrane-bound spermidine synthase
LASGAAALIFETLWFRLTGLMLGNGVWASSVVLAGFMAGLALGNGLSAGLAPRWRRPLRVYALLELVVALLGLAVVLGLPRLTPWLMPVLLRGQASPVALNATRLAIAFVLMAAPAAAMGATLPTLVRALSAEGRSFGAVLGGLYAANTAGAVLGALAGEMLLVERLGLRGTALAAALLDLLAAGAALAVARRAPALASPASGPPSAPTRGGLLLVAAGACGAALLALEVVWFRFLTLMVLGTGLAFAVMLAVVLAGIAAGGFLAGRWCARHPDPGAAAGPVAFVTGAALIASYATFARPTGRLVAWPGDVLPLALRLMLPVCVLSGALFVLLGARLRARLGEDARSAGVLTLANTLGAGAGSLLAGFVLLPRLGIERSVFVVAVGYGAVGLALSRPFRRAAVLAGLAALAAALAWFPWSVAERTIHTQATRYAGDGSHIVAVREGRLETLTYLRLDLWGEPYSYRLITNGFSMAGTNVASRRYMKLLAYWPLALRPETRTALVVCFGVGNTVQALVAVPGLRSVDVVDISPDVIAMSTVIHPPDRHPLRDPRVRVHVEDGRFFLQATARRFDLITAEPPPPKNAGVVNLYSREYFQLVRDRLTEGGIATHWLPVYQLSAADARAIVGGFCTVFPDCSLWSGRGLEWMLAGTRGLRHGPSEAGFARLWEEPAVRAELRSIALEGPEQLGATFLADAGDLRAFSAGEPVLDDDHPLRLSSRPPAGVDPLFSGMLGAEPARERFARSEWVRATWPPALRERTLGAFWTQDVFNRLLAGAGPRLGDLRRIMAETSLRTLPLLLLESDEDEVRLAEAAARRGVPDPMVPYVRGLGALADRDWPRADGLFAEAERRGAPVPDLATARAFVREMAQPGVLDIQASPATLNPAAARP